MKSNRVDTEALIVFRPLDPVLVQSASTFPFRVVCSYRRCIRWLDRSWSMRDDFAYQRDVLYRWGGSDLLSTSLLFATKFPGFQKDLCAIHRERAALCADHGIPTMAYLSSISTKSACHQLFYSITPLLLLSAGRTSAGGELMEIS